MKLLMVVGDESFNHKEAVWKALDELDKHIEDGPIKYLAELEGSNASAYATMWGNNLALTDTKLRLYQSPSRKKVKAKTFDLHQQYVNVGENPAVYLIIFKRHNDSLSEEAEMFIDECEAISKIKVKYIDYPELTTLGRPN